MVEFAELLRQVRERTATDISPERFAALLHKWAKHNAPEFDACQRKREHGAVYLTDAEASAFTNWVSSISKSQYKSLNTPVTSRGKLLWARKKPPSNLTYNWR